MAEKTDAWMPLWIGAYLADTQHLSRDEHGGYLLLLMAYWRAGAPLPDDDKRLSAIAKATAKEWRVLRPVLAEFFAVGDGVWRHKRVDEELAGALDRKTRASGKAKAAAEARWKQGAGNAPSIAQSNAPSMPGALHKECPTPSPTPIHSEPNGSGGDAASLTKDELWKAGKSLLQQQGMPAAQCGTFVGKLVKDYGDLVVVQAVRSAVVARPADVASYLKAACQHAKGERISPHVAKLIETNRALTGGMSNPGGAHAALTFDMD